MGTRYTVRVVSGDASERQSEISQRVEEALHGIDAKMSTYKPSSELSRFNLQQATEPFPLSEDTLEVLAASREISRLSGGAFDVTVGPLVNALGFGPGGQAPRVPADEDLERLLALVGWQKLEVDAAAGTVRKTLPELYVDLSAVAKGYAVDRAAAVLDEMGLTDYMVEVGGEVRTRGLNLKRQPWRIGIERPVAESRELQQVVPLSGLSMATSGDYRNFYVLDGRRYSHTIDARTGRPVTHGAASVSVVTEECLWADGWATALMVLGPEEGFVLAEEQGLAALFLIYHEEGSFEERPTEAFRELMGAAKDAA